jgi:hypothetical protein
MVPEWNLVALLTVWEKVKKIYLKRGQQKIWMLNNYGTN